MFRTTLFFVFVLNTVFYIIWLLDICRVTNIFHLYNSTTNTLGPVQVMLPGVVFFCVWVVLAVLTVKNLKWRLRRDLKRACSTEHDWRLVKNCV
jgi:hypothetical protein